MYNFQNIWVIENRKVNLMLFQNYTTLALEIRHNDLAFHWECGVEVW
jgi:hypothetical protein